MCICHPFSLLTPKICWVLKAVHEVSCFRRFTTLIKSLRRHILVESSTSKFPNDEPETRNCCFYYVSSTKGSKMGALCNVISHMLIRKSFSFLSHLELWYSIVFDVVVCVCVCVCGTCVCGREWNLKGFDRNSKHV